MTPRLALTPGREGDAGTRIRRRRRSQLLLLHLRRHAQEPITPAIQIGQRAVALRNAALILPAPLRASALPVEAIAARRGKTAATARRASHNVVATTIAAGGPRSAVRMDRAPGSAARQDLPVTLTWRTLVFRRRRVSLQQQNLSPVVARIGSAPATKRERQAAVEGNS